MAGHDSELAIEARDRLVFWPLEPVDCFSAVTLVAALVAGMAGAVSGVLFLVASLMALLVLRQLDLPSSFEFAFAIGIALQGWGNALLLFERIGWYDKAVHFLTPILVVPSLYLLLARAGAVPPRWSNGLRRGTIGVLVVTVALGSALATVWELIEGTSDRWLGTSLAHGYFETIDDLYSSLLGSVAAGALLAWHVISGDRALAVEPLVGETMAEPEQARTYNSVT